MYNQKIYLIRIYMKNFLTSIWSSIIISALVAIIVVCASIGETAPAINIIAYGSIAGIILDLIKELVTFHGLEGEWNGKTFAKFFGIGAISAIIGAIIAYFIVF